MSKYALIEPRFQLNTANFHEWLTELKICAHGSGCKELFVENELTDEQEARAMTMIGRSIPEHARDVVLDKKTAKEAMKYLHAAYGSDRPAQALVTVMELVHLSQKRENGEYEPMRNYVERAKALRARAQRIKGFEIGDNVLLCLIAMGLREEFTEVQGQLFQGEDFIDLESAIMILETAEISRRQGVQN
jgi:hypothetical protein